MKKKVFLITILLGLLVIGSFMLLTKEKYGIQKISTEQLIELENKKKSFVVYIGRPTCSSCKEFHPILEKFVDEEKLIVSYYNTDEARSIDAKAVREQINKFNITSVPTVLLITDGKVTDKLEHGIKYEDLISFKNRNNL